MTDSKTIKCKLQLVRDNNSMINKVTEMQAYPGTIHSVALHPEWYVLNSLFNERKQLKLTTKIMWVASHQDDNTEVSNLSIPSQVNFRADKLATKALKKLTPKSFVPMESSTIAQLYHCSQTNSDPIQCSYTSNHYPRTIISNIKHTVQRLIKLRSIKKYFHKRFG